MKRDHLFIIKKVVAALFWGAVVSGCQENRTEPVFTPEQKEKQLLSISDDLTALTLDYDESNSTALDEVIAKIEKYDYVKRVEKHTDHIKVTYSDGLEVYYPFLLPSAFDGADVGGLFDELSFTEDDLDQPKTRAGGIFDGGYEIYDFFSEDPDRRNQREILKETRGILFDAFGFGSSEGSMNYVYHGKEMLTIKNIENSIQNPYNKIVVISSHGFANAVITSETEQISTAAKNEKIVETEGDYYVDIGQVDDKGNRVFNKAWRPMGCTHWGCSMVYITGCGVMAPAVRSKLNEVSKTLVVGWDGITNLAEAYFLALCDSFAQGMSFQDFYQRTGSHSDWLHGSNMVYAGQTTNFKPGSNSLSFGDGHSYFLWPKYFCDSYYMALYTVESVLDDQQMKDGYYYVAVYDFNKRIYKKSSWLARESGFDWLDNLLTESDFSVSFYLKAPNVYRISLYHCMNENETGVLVDQKYVIRPRGFKTNEVEDGVPEITVATAVADNEPGSILYGGQLTVCPDDLTRQGFLLWDRDNPDDIQEVAGVPLEKSPHIFQASPTDLTMGKTYQVKAFVEYVTGDLFYGNVKEFSPQWAVLATEPTPGDLIDLGLSVKWASCNLGASEPQDIGDFYAWGETSTKSSYDWSNYRLCNGTENSLSKYCSQSTYGVVDNKTSLDPTDDAAYVNSQGVMRIPTQEQWQELKDRCIWTKMQYKDRDGYLVASPMTGNAIFIPCNGFKTATNHYNSYAPYYWTSTLSSESSSDAVKFSFINQWALGSQSRFEGLGVRPVSDGEVDIPTEIDVSPTMLDFGKVPIGTSSSKSVIVSNTGNGSLTFHVAGAEGWFTVDPVEETTLAPGQSIEVIVTFSPKAATQVGAVLRFFSNATNGTKYVECEGEGIESTVTGTDVIRYTSTGGVVVSPYKEDAFGGANILSNEYQDGQGVIRFDKPVTTIGEMAFYECENLVSMTIPESVTQIGKAAFIRCSNLESIDIPDGVSVIGKNAFFDCVRLAVVSVPASLAVLESNAFEGCSSLAAFPFPKGIRQIGDNSFRGCSSLRSIEIPESVSSIGDLAFAQCSSLSSIVVAPHNQTYDSRNNCNAIMETSSGVLLAGCNNTVIPNNTTAIGFGAFFGCSGLKAVDIPATVTTIGNSAFCGCSGLTYIAIPDGISKIGSSCFEGCSSLTGISLPDSIQTIGNYSFSHCSSLQGLTIPENVTRIGYSAFLGCSSLSTVSIPQGVTEIDSGTFEECTNLVSVSIPNGVTVIGPAAFQKCTHLASVFIPGTVESIMEVAFNDCTSLSEVTLENGVASIGEYAFQRCGLKSVVLPESVTSIDRGAFGYCTEMTSITSLPSIPPSGVTSMFFADDLALIYVPSESVEAYKAAEGWKDYADRIRAIGEAH